MEIRLPEVQELLETWTVSLESDGKASGTIKVYRERVEKYIKYLHQNDVSWEAVTPTVLDAWKADLVRGQHLSARTVNTFVCAVRSLYRFAKWRGYIPTALPLDLHGVKPPRLLPKPISERDVLRIIDGAETVMERALLEVLYSTGCRASELVGMRLRDVDLEAGVILTLGKGAQERYLDVGAPALEALKEHLKTLADPGPQAFLWPGRKPGTHITAYGPRAIIRRIGKKIGNPAALTAHMFRHSFATHMMDRGADLREVQEAMGHKSIASTVIYTGVTRQRVKRAHKAYHPRA